MKKVVKGLLTHPMPRDDCSSGKYEESRQWMIKEMPRRAIKGIFGHFCFRKGRCIDGQMRKNAQAKIAGEMDVNPHIFREFSIRGIADHDLTDDVVIKIGQAIGTFFEQRGGQSLVVGRDVRHSSARINSSLIAGMLQRRLRVIDVGVVPTPVHNFATDLFAADGGVMITASHNPPEHNGLKIRTDRTLRGDELLEIYRLAAGISKGTKFVQRAKPPTNAEAGPATHSTPSDGRLQYVDPLLAYLERIKTHADISPKPGVGGKKGSHGQRSLKIVVDGGNGANGLIVPHLLRELGCEVVELYCEPDGNFPNRSPDPTAPGATTDLSASVRAEGGDLGVAYDADGDRLVVVDERGNTVLGDQVIMILARDVLRRGPAKIVYEILCTQALADDVIAHGGEPVMTASGYAFVHQAMRDTGAVLGGEFSGHFFFNEPDFRFDDPILATLRMLNIVSHSQRPLSSLVADLPGYYSSPQIRLPCPDEMKRQVVEQVKSHFKAFYPVDELDGARIDFGDGWALVRASNTQPVLSLRFEATSERRLEQLKAQVLDQVEHWMTRPE
jgi:phosphomannomutase/phosphoglucomutase